jgi:membrane associated rhomboid family serine protease
VGPPITPVVRGLLIACIAVFGLQLWLDPWVEINFAMWSPESPRFHVWQILTSAFLHADWIHLLVNCMVLHSFGPPMEKLLGPRRFIVYFLVSAMAGSLLQLLAQSLGLSYGGYSLGASTGTSGLVLGFAMAYPRHKMVIFPIPVPLAAWICVAGFAALSLVLALTGYAPGIGHFAHLGGMIGGLALILYWRSKVGRSPT